MGGVGVGTEGGRWIRKVRGEMDAYSRLCGRGQAPHQVVVLLMVWENQYN